MPGRSVASWRSCSPASDCSLATARPTSYSESPACSGSMPLAAVGQIPSTRREVSRLRELFREERLSHDGFEVLVFYTRPRRASAGGHGAPMPLV